MTKILTPIATDIMVKRMLEAGYIEEAQNFPLVSEIGDQFLFISKDQIEGGYIISSWFIEQRDFRSNSYHECETFEEACSAFSNFQREIMLTFSS